MPGASRSAQMSPSKVNVVLVSSSVSARWEGRKCGSGGLEQVAVESEQDVVLYIIAGAAGGGCDAPRRCLE